MGGHVKVRILLPHFRGGPSGVRDFGCFIQGHSADLWQCWDGSPDPNLAFSTLPLSLITALDPVEEPMGSGKASWRREHLSQAWEVQKEPQRRRGAGPGVAVSEARHESREWQ